MLIASCCCPKGTAGHHTLQLNIQKVSEVCALHWNNAKILPQILNIQETAQLGTPGQPLQLSKALVVLIASCSCAHGKAASHTLQRNAQNVSNVHTLH
jgi:hypothetical protein